MYIINIYFLCLIVCFTSGCISFRAQPSAGIPRTANSLDGTWHSILIEPPRKLAKITAGNKINPVWWFGNADDPIPPKDYSPGTRCRRFRWFMRNSGHNLSFYVIGIGDKEFVRSGRYPALIGNPHGGWNYAVSAYGHWRLPFISYESRHMTCYLGWRNRGNFGTALRWNSKAREFNKK